VTYDVDPDNQYDDDGLWDYIYDNEGNLTGRESLLSRAEF
jgi:hypothetical protein